MYTFLEKHTIAYFTISDADPLLILTLMVFIRLGGGVYFSSLDAANGPGDSYASATSEGPGAGSGAGGASPCTGTDNSPDVICGVRGCHAPRVPAYGKHQVTIPAVPGSNTTANVKEVPAHCTLGCLENRVKNSINFL